MNPAIEIPGGARLRRRILLLTHYFPPSSGVGALRWRKMSALLAEEGWGVDVIASSPTCDGLLDDEAIADLPAGLRVWHADDRAAIVHLPERAVLRMLRMVTGRRPKGDAARTSVPRPRQATLQAEIAWNLHTPKGYLRLYSAGRDVLKERILSRHVAGIAQRVLDRSVHKVVVSSGPPHAWHVAGRVTAKRSRIPFVMDLRDPWSMRHRLSDGVATPPWRMYLRSQESRAVHDAALVVANTDSLRDMLRRAYPSVRDRVITVMNGYDDDPLPAVARPQRFTVSYLGAIYGGRDPRPLFAGFAIAVRDLGLSPAQITLRFIGDVHAFGRVPVRDLAAAEGIGDYLELVPRVPRTTALEMMAQSHLLVSLPWPDAVSVPAKIFEYIRFPAWLLAFVNPGSELERLLSGMDVDLVHAQDVAGVGAALGRRYLQHAAGDFPKALSSDVHLSRRYQVSKLVSALQDRVR
jgi:glycosyltransferase involved in cell wall biosynthesis